METGMLLTQSCMNTKMDSGFCRNDSAKAFVIITRSVSNVVISLFQWAADVLVCPVVLATAGMRQTGRSAGHDARLPHSLRSFAMTALGGLP